MSSEIEEGFASLDASAAETAITLSLHLSDCHLSFFCHRPSVPHFGIKDGGMGIKPHALQPNMSLSPQIQHHLTSHHPPLTLHFSVSTTTTNKKVCFVHIVHHASRIMHLCACVRFVCAI